MRKCINLAKTTPRPSMTLPLQILEWISILKIRLDVVINNIRETDSNCSANKLRTGNYVWFQLQNRKQNTAYARAHSSLFHSITTKLESSVTHKTLCFCTALTSKDVYRLVTCMAGFVAVRLHYKDTVRHVFLPATDKTRKLSKMDAKMEIVYNLKHINYVLITNVHTTHTNSCSLNKISTSQPLQSPTGRSTSYELL